jgi:hypothetical protein
MTTLASELQTWSGSGYTAVTPSRSYTSPALMGSGQGDQYWGQVLTNMGAPVTQSNIDFLNGWSSREGTKATWNPLATTQGPGAGTFNSTGVQNFATLDQGAQYTAATLTNGHYPSIVAALKSGDASGANGGGVLAAGDPSNPSSGIAAGSGAGSTSGAMTATLASAASSAATSVTGGQQVSLGIQPTLFGDIQKWITDISKGVWSGVWTPVATAFQDIQNWFIRAFVIVVGLVILAIGLIKITGADEKILAMMKEAAPAALAA